MALAAAVAAVAAFGATLPASRPRDSPPLAFPLTSGLDGPKEPFPDLLTSEASKSLSLIVPMYNEEERLGVMMDETMTYLEGRAQADRGFSYELILVDDGSSDATAAVAAAYVDQFSPDVVRLCRLPANRGKGGAVRAGMLAARGEMLLMVDADGATQFSDLDRLEAALNALAAGHEPPLAVAVGSRAHLQDDAVAERTFFRNLLMHVFHSLVSTLCVSGIRDTQCGFKLFSRAAAQLIFPHMHLERWAFDVEALYIAQRLAIPVAEVSVNWEEIPGSKLSVVQASIQMAIDLVRIRLAYTLGFWSV